MPHESLLRRGQLRWTDISEIFVFTDFYVGCQKMAIKIKEIEPRTVSTICLCTHVIVVHSMKLMIRSTSPFERGPGETSVDLLLWFFYNVTSRVNRVNRATAAHTHNRNRIHIRIRIRNSFTKGTALPLLRVSLLWLKHRSRRSLNCRAERSTYNQQQRLSQRQRQRQQRLQLQLRRWLRRRLRLRAVWVARATHEHVL